MNRILVHDGYIKFYTILYALHLNNIHTIITFLNYHRFSGREILKAFYKHEYILVRKYSIWKHSPLVRAALWFVFILLLDLPLVNHLNMTFNRRQYSARILSKRRLYYI